MKAVFNYDSQNGIAKVTLSKQGISASATARVHPDDIAHASEFTGLTIAEMRAYKKFVQKRIRRKLAMEKRLLAQSQYYKKLAEEDQEIVERIEEEILFYIQSKADFYNKLRTPPTPIKWADIDTDKLSENFKRALEDSNGDAH